MAMRALLCRFGAMHLPVRAAVDGGTRYALRRSGRVRTYSLGPEAARPSSLITAISVRRLLFGAAPGLDHIMTSLYREANYNNRSN
jgi:hypothetical protein